MKFSALMTLIIVTQLYLLNQQQLKVSFARTGKGTARGRRTNYRIVVDNLSRETSWQVDTIYILGYM